MTGSCDVTGTVMFPGSVYDVTGSCDVTGTVM